MVGNYQKTTVYENYGTIFGGTKACSVGMAGTKFRISIASQLQQNGNLEWDFRNQTGISLDVDDLERVLLACKQMAAIYLENVKNPSAVATNPILATTQIRIPLVAKLTGKAYGTFTVGLVEDKVAPGKTFAIQYNFTSLKDNQETSDYFTFHRSLNNEGQMSFCDANGNDIKTVICQHFQFSTFVQQLESAVKIGRIMMGVHSAIKYSGGGFHSSHQNGGGNSGTGNNGGYASSPSSDDDDIPF